MRNRLIDKTAVTAFLDELREANQVFAPLTQGGILGFALLEKDSEAVLDFANTRLAPKEIFFPRSETLFTYEDGQTAPVPQAREQRVVFGMRPCDARSAVLLDMVFDTPDYRDPYYVDRRKSTVLIINNASSLPVPELASDPEDFSWTAELKIGG